MPLSRLQALLPTTSGLALTAWLFADAHEHATGAIPDRDITIQLGAVQAGSGPPSREGLPCWTNRDKIAVKSAAAGKGKTLGTLPASRPLRCLERSGKWWKVNVDGRQGWIEARRVSSEIPSIALDFTEADAQLTAGRRDAALVTLGLMAQVGQEGSPGEQRLAELWLRDRIGEVPNPRKPLEIDQAQLPCVDDATGPRGVLVARHPESVPALFVLRSDDWLAVHLGRGETVGWERGHWRIEPNGAGCLGVLETTDRGTVEGDRPWRAPLAFALTARAATTPVETWR